MRLCHPPRGLPGAPSPVPRATGGRGGLGSSQEGPSGQGAARSGASCALTPGPPSLQPGPAPGPQPPPRCVHRNLRAPSPSSPFSPSCRSPGRPFRRPAAHPAAQQHRLCPHSISVALEGPRAPSGRSRTTHGPAPPGPGPSLQARMRLSPAVPKTRLFGLPARPALPEVSRCGPWQCSLGGCQPAAITTEVPEE